MGLVYNGVFFKKFKARLSQYIIQMVGDFEEDSKIGTFRNVMEDLDTTEKIFDEIYSNFKQNQAF